MDAATVEYINGIEVIKAFNQGGTSYKKFTDAVKENEESTALRNKYFIFLSIFPLFYFSAFYPLLSCKLFELSTFYGRIMPVLKFCG